MAEQKEMKSDDADSSGVTLTAQNKTLPKLKSDLFQSLPDVVRQLYKHKPTYSLDGKTGSVTFYPSPHMSKSKYGTKVLQTEAFCESAQLQHFLSKVGSSGLESVYDWDAQIVKKNDPFNGFARAMEIAYFDHYPLRIKVSHIWLLIMQGLAAHVDVNAEKLRDKYVAHDGKKTLTVNRPGFVKGSRKNEWGSVITEFAAQIDKNTVNDVAQLLKNDFSVTTDLEKVATQVTLMAACKSYFNYVVRYGCGFPQITLDGTKQDWLNLKRKVETVLKDFVDQAWAAKWKAPLFDVLDRFIGAYDGEIDCLFWNSMVRRGRTMSGMMIPNEDPSNQNSYYSGWINILFPYLNQMRRLGGFGGGQSRQKEGVHNDDGSTVMQENGASQQCYDIAQHTRRSSHGKDVLANVLGQSSSLKVFPVGLATAPVLLIDDAKNEQYKLKFVSGFIGVEQNKETLEVLPKVGWFIADE